VHKQLQLSVGKLVYSVLLSCQHFATRSLIIGSSTITALTLVPMDLTGFDRGRQLFADLHKPPPVHKVIQSVLETVY